MNLRTIQGILLGAAVGMAFGVGAHTFAYARGWAYLTEDAAACADQCLRSRMRDNKAEMRHMVVTKLQGRRPNHRRTWF
jgi:cytochrome c nitrite reductase small subunit